MRLKDIQTNSTVMLVITIAMLVLTVFGLGVSIYQKDWITARPWAIAALMTIIALLQRFTINWKDERIEYLEEYYEHDKETY